MRNIYRIFMGILGILCFLNGAYGGGDGPKLQVKRVAQIVRSGKLLSLEITVPVYIRKGTVWVSEADISDAGNHVAMMEQFSNRLQAAANTADAMALKWEAYVKGENTLSSD